MRFIEWKICLPLENLSFVVLLYGFQLWIQMQKSGWTKFQINLWLRRERFSWSEGRWLGKSCSMIYCRLLNFNSGTLWMFFRCGKSQTVVKLSLYKHAVSKPLQRQEHKTFSKLNSIVFADYISKMAPKHSTIKPFNDDFLNYLVLILFIYCFENNSHP